jgi:hypothetical protein
MPVRRFVLPTSPRRLKLREATSGRLSSNPGERSGGVLRTVQIAPRVALEVLSGRLICGV